MYTNSGTTASYNNLFALLLAVHLYSVAVAVATVCNGIKSSDVGASPVRSIKFSDLNDIKIFIM